MTPPADAGIAPRVRDDTDMPGPDDDTPLALIHAVRPEHLVKGGDWPVERIVGATEVCDWGGSVHSIPFRFDRSTTSLIDRIQAAGG